MDLSYRELSGLFDRDDPRFLYFLRLATTFGQREELTRESVEALWVAAERSRQIDEKERQWQTRYSTRRNYGVGPQVVYYVGLGNLVKIGTTRNLIGRMECLGVRQLLGLEPGGVSEEHARHRQFQHLREHLEWFRHGADLDRHVASLPQDWRDVAATVSLVPLMVSARALGVDYSTVYRWAEKGLVCKYGNKVDQYEVEAYAAKVRNALPGQAA